MAEEQGSFSQFIQQIGDVIDNIHRQVGQSLSAEALDHAIRQLESVLANLNRTEALISTEAERVCYDTHLNSLQNYIALLKEQQSSHSENHYPTPQQKRGGKGRPKHVITKEQLQYFLAANFKVKDAASILGVSRSTIYNRFRSVRARLQSQNIKVCYAKVREIMLRLDPAAVAIRYGNAVKRRTYKVAGPNSLWHIDGNHKLIRWKFVVHGCVDGFSRTITYMDVATNNRSETVYKSFMKAVQKYGWPSRIRSDQGVENVKVVQKMIEHRGQGRGSAIIGTSVHNQRIERTWRDVYQGCLCVYYDLFTLLEACGILNVDNPTHMFALHYTYKPLIQRSLDEFTSSFNIHPLSTENCRSPLQLWIEGVIRNSHNPTSVASSVYENEQLSENEIQDYGIDEDAPSPDISEISRMQSLVELDDIRCPFEAAVHQHLKENIDPLNDAQDPKAIDVFKNVLQYIFSRVSS